MNEKIEQAIQYFQRLKLYADRFQETYPEYPQCKQMADLAIDALGKQLQIKPPMDMWFMCPSCGNEGDFSDLDGFVAAPEDGYPDMLHWIGPSFCKHCGQSLDMSELNEGSGDDT